MGFVDRIRAALEGVGVRLAERLRGGVGPLRLFLEEPDVWGSGYLAPVPEQAPGGEWAPVQSGLGVKVRKASRAYATPKTRLWVASAGVVAAAQGGDLQVADVSGPEPGPFPPHVSHQQGRDFDTAYKLTKYPTPVGDPASLEFVTVMSAMRDGIEVVGVSPERKAEIEAIAAQYGLVLPKLSAWPGHQTHAHVRLRP